MYAHGATPAQRSHKQPLSSQTLTCFQDARGCVTGQVVGMQHQPIHRFSSLHGVASPHGAVPFCSAAAADSMLACLFCMHSRWRVIRVVCGAERAARSFGTCARAWACCCGCGTCCPGVRGCGDDSGSYLGSCCCVLHITPVCRGKQMLPPTAYALLRITTGHALQV